MIGQIFDLYKLFQPQGYQFERLRCLQANSRKKLFVNQGDGSPSQSFSKPDRSSWPEPATLVIKQDRTKYSELLENYIFVEEVFSLIGYAAQ